MYFAIERHHWKPSDIREWLDEEPDMQALFYATAQLHAKARKEEMDKINSK